ncbi:MAG: flagellar basal body P-ring formation protein FlgA [Burkholderiales bacterium]|nr:flagellar basal body P-ring formation protein FlgA [Burkholderiales bacterium]
MTTTTHFRPARARFARAAAIAAAALVALPAGAQSGAPADPVRLYLERATAGLPGRVEVSIGRLDERLNLAPCAQVEPYLPGQARLWGRSQIGLRCVSGASWNVYLPVEVRVFGQALVASRPIAFGQTVMPEDMRIDEVELSRENGMPAVDPQAIEGRLAIRGIAAGMPLRPEYFRAAPVVGAGDTVRLVYNGAGFTVTASGRALASAPDGAPVRVQTESGRIVQGIARAGRLVEMRL